MTLSQLIDLYSIFMAYDMLYHIDYTEVFINTKIVDLMIKAYNRSRK